MLKLFFPILFVCSIAGASVEDVLKQLPGHWVPGGEVPVRGLELQFEAYHADQPWNLLEGTIDFSSSNGLIYKATFSKNTGGIGDVYFMTLTDPSGTKTDYVLSNSDTKSGEYNFWTRSQTEDGKRTSATGVRFSIGNNQLLNSAWSWANVYCKDPNKISECGGGSAAHFYLVKQP